MQAPVIIVSLFVARDTTLAQTQFCESTHTNGRKFQISAMRIFRKWNDSYKRTKMKKNTRLKLNIYSAKVNITWTNSFTSVQCYLYNFAEQLTACTFGNSFTMPVIRTDMHTNIYVRCNQ